MSELKLLPCPFCHAQAKIGYACGDYFVHCSDRCPSPMCDHASESTTVCSWNDWAEWYEKNRRADGKDTNVPTNTDKIRSMTDEELAEFLWEQNGSNRYWKSVDKYVDWLQQPAETEGKE